MLHLRRDQFDRFGLIRKAACIEELAQELTRFAPRLSDVIGQQGCVALAALAAHRSGELGFVRRSSIRLILELMCSLGAEFPDDPQLPWAFETLRRTVGMEEQTRASLLHRRALAYLDEVHGENQCHAIRALQRTFLDDGRSSPRVRATLDGFANFAAQTFPEKHGFVGTYALRTLYADAEFTAARHQLGQQGAMLLASLAFALGSGVLRDPAYPWISRTLVDQGFGEGERRTERLYRRVSIYAREVLTSTLPATHDAQS